MSELLVLSGCVAIAFGLPLGFLAWSPRLLLGAARQPGPVRYPAVLAVQALAPLAIFLLLGLGIAPRVAAIHSTPYFTRVEHGEIVSYGREQPAAGLVLLLSAAGGTYVALGLAWALVRRDFGGVLRLWRFAYGRWVPRELREAEALEHQRALAKLTPEELAALGARLRASAEQAREQEVAEARDRAKRWRRLKPRR